MTKGTSVVIIYSCWESDQCQKNDDSVRVRHITFFWAREHVRSIDNTAEGMKDDNSTLLVDVKSMDDALNGTSTGNITTRELVKANNT